MAIWTAQNKNAASFSNQAYGKSGAILAPAGLYYGFGAFTYSGGQSIAPGTLPVFTNQSKHSATFTNQTIS